MRPNARPVTPEEVAEIVALWELDYRIYKIAKMVGRNYSTVGYVVRREIARNDAADLEDEREWDRRNAV